MTTTPLEPFEIHVPDEVLDDLQRRLDRTRLGVPADVADWDLGTPGAYVEELVAHWRDAYDWREHEAGMNRHPHYRVVLDGIPIHVMRVENGGALPLLLLHGWPWTFWDFQKVVEPLASPGPDGFDVVVASLPGYGFSTPMPQTGVNVTRIAALMDRLMTEVLGFDRYLVHGGDWGALVSSRLGAAHDESVLGIHITLPMPLPLFGSRLPPPEDYAPSEAGWRDRTKAFHLTESAYSALQSTKPETIAAAMNDSPAGLIAWLVEKRRTWSDCGGDVESVFTKDDLVTTAMLYWATRSFGSAARLYHAERHDPWRPPDGRWVEVPTGICLSPNDVVLMPRRWVERHYEVTRWTVLGAGGHFAPMEQPDALVADLRAFARPLR
jgi:pimeloyl-ACP methyl ester carboxylesterase